MLRSIAGQSAAGGRAAGGAWDEKGARAGWVSCVRAGGLGWDSGKAPAAAETSLVTLNILIELMMVFMDQRIEQPRLERT